jgi:tetratricopeptide (TPR) repeat protein
LTYQRAIDLARRRIAIEPKRTAALRLLADTLGNRIESLNLLQRPEDSAATYVEKLNIEEQLSNQDPQNPEGLMRVAETAQAYGETLQSIHQDDEAKAQFQKAIEHGTRSVDLVKAQTNTPQQRVDLALMQEKLASMFEHLDEGPNAIQTYREAIATATAVHAEHPEIVQGLRNTTSSHWYLGLLLDRQGDHRGALENYRASLKAVLDATAGDPSIDPWRGGETKYSIVVGKALCKLGETNEGVPLIRNGIELQLHLIESDKGNRQDTYYGSEVLGWAVEGLAAAGLRDEAKTVSLTMIDWAEETARNAPEDGGPRLRLVLLYQQLGDVYAGYDSDTRKVGAAERGRLIEARRYYEKGLDVLREIDVSFRVSKSILQEHSSELQERLSESDARLGR